MTIAHIAILHTLIQQIVDRFGPIEAATVLLTKVEDSDWKVRATVADLLGAHCSGDPRVREVLEGMLYDPEWHAVPTVAKALGELGDPAAVPALSQFLFMTTNGQIERAIAEALGKLGGAAVIPTLVRLRYKAGQWMTVQTVVAVLEKIGPAAIPALEELIEGDVSKTKESTMWARQALERLRG